MENLYEWKMPEVPLATELVTAKHMTIRSIDKNGPKITAEGTFTFYDHGEGIAGVNPWVAVGDMEEPKFKWTVRRKEPEGEDYAFKSEEGEPLFCILSETNAAIKTFIASRLTDVFARISSDPSLTHIVESYPKYEGEMFKYEGSCLCRDLDESDVVNPFSWQKHTGGGKFPTDCFACSCGQNWYRGYPSEEKWLRVGDEKAFAMLLENNGMPVEPIVVHPQLHPSTLFLQTSLRDEGYIPLD